MKYLKKIFAVLACVLTGYIVQAGNPSSWSLVLHRPGKQPIEIIRLPADISKGFKYTTIADNVQISFSLEPAKGYTIFKAIAYKPSGKASIYFSLRNNYAGATPYNFDGEVKGPEIFRQSRHDINAWSVRGIAEQAVPVIALKRDTVFEVALNGSPALYNNFTSQAFYTYMQIAELSSGDNGETPGLKPDTAARIKMEVNAEKTQVFAPGKVLPFYHLITAARKHVFEGIIFISNAATVQQLRKDINQKAATHFSAGKYTDYFGAVSFTTAYMNLRINETGKSTYWVVPSVEYNNVQYCRDAFWIANMLPPAIAADCLKNELAKVNMYAEYPLITVIWAYKSWKAKNKVNLPGLQRYITAIDSHVKNNYYYSYSDSDGRLDFQYWNDLMAFDTTDVVTYNQGLYALAIQAAKEMGLTTKSDPGKALKNYQGMFNQALGFYPASKNKNTVMGPDPLIPDLLSQLYFNKQMLPSKNVTLHYSRMVKYAKTPNGFKVVALPDGQYLPDSLYDVKGYQSQVNRGKITDGQYCRGGSYFLYDNLFLIDAWMHGIKDAATQLTWRASLDFVKGGTTFECLNTVTGEPWKPNMGWNVAVYAIWKQLVDSGRADKKLFDTIDMLTKF